MPAARMLATRPRAAEGTLSPESVLVSGKDGGISGVDIKVTQLT